MPTVLCTTDNIVRLETSVRDGKVVAVIFSTWKTHTHTHTHTHTQTNRILHRDIAF